MLSSIQVTRQTIQPSYILDLAARAPHCLLTTCYLLEQFHPVRCLMLYELREEDTIAGRRACRNLEKPLQVCRKHLFITAKTMPKQLISAITGTIATSFVKLCMSAVCTLCRLRRSTLS